MDTQVKSILYFSLFGDRASLDDEELNTSWQRSFADGTLFVSLDEKPGSFSFRYSEIENPSANWNCILKDEGEYEITRKGVKELFGHHHSFYPFLDAMNLPRNLLVFDQGFARLGKRTDLEILHWPLERATMKLAYRSKGEHGKAPVVTSIGQLQACTAVQFAEGLSAVKTGIAMGPDYFKALCGSPKRAKKWVAENLFVFAPDGSRGFQDKYSIELRLRTKAVNLQGRPATDAIYNIFNGLYCTGVARVFHFLVEQHGLLPLIEDCVDNPEYLPEASVRPISLAQLAAAKAMDNIHAAADYFKENLPIAAVEVDGSNERRFCIKFTNKSMSDREFVESCVESTKSISLDRPPPVFAEYDHVFKALLEKHGAHKLSSLLHAKVRPDLRLKMPSFYQNYQSMGEEKGFLFGLPLVETGKDCEGLEFIGSSEQFYPIEGRRLVKNAQCISNPSKTDLNPNARIVAFLRDGKRGHCQHEVQSELPEAQAYAPVAKRNCIYIVLVMETITGTKGGFSTLFYDSSIWAFCGRVEDDEFLMAPADPELRFCTQPCVIWTTAQVFYQPDLLRAK